MDSPRHRGASLVWAGLKLAICGATICAIAFAITVFDLSVEVPELHADIVWFGADERSNTEQFEGALEEMGHDSPRRYDLEGNAVFFSTNTSRKSLDQLMVEYQERFRLKGLNDDIYDDVPHDQFAGTEEALTGGIIPLVVEPNRVVLGGAITRNRAEDGADLIENFADAETPDELLRGHRYIEMTRPDDRRHTSIVATWSDESFDHSTMLFGSDSERRPVDTEVPACPGCVRVSRFADDAPAQGDHVEVSYTSPASVDEVARFYARALRSRGWSPTLPEALRELSTGDHRVDRRVDNTELYRRDDAFLLIGFGTDPETGHTLVTATRSASR